MIQYNFEAYDPHEQITTTKEFQAESLITILQEFQYFLKGAGFEFDGNIEIVPEDNYESELTTSGFDTHYPDYVNDFNIKVK